MIGGSSEDSLSAAFLLSLYVGNRKSRAFGTELFLAVIFSPLVGELFFYPRNQTVLIFELCNNYSNTVDFNVD